MKTEIELYEEYESLKDALLYHIIESDKPNIETILGISMSIRILAWVLKNEQ